jgi:hypothetical protein
MSRRTRLACCLVATGLGGWLLPAAAQAAPTFTVGPSIAGTAQQGQTLTVTPANWTDATDPAITVTDAWEDCVAGTCTPNGTTGSSYTLGSTDVGATIEVVETATTPTDGSAQTPSAATATVLPAAPVNTGLPTITGTAQVGQQLTASTGTWNNGPTTFDYQWQSCSGATCSAVGSDSSTYAVAATDVGHTIEVQVTATNGGGSSTPAISAATTAVPGAPVNSALPTITGTAQQGQTLTAGPGTWTNTPTFGYQWESCTTAAPITCTAITGATAATYILASTDVGKTIEVQVKASDSAGSGTATSAPTAAVIALAPVTSVAPTISGTAQQGQTLTAGAGTWTNTPVSYTYQWESCTNATPTTCTAIAGATVTTAATTFTYVVAAADVGKTIEVLVTATNTGGNSAPAASLPTAVVVPPVPTETFAPSISGLFQQGSVLTEAHGGWTNTPTSYAYQWMLCDSAGANCAAISGATAQTYTPVAADVGGTLVILETAANAGGSSAPSESALTPVITTPAKVVPAPVSSSPPTLSGSLQQGQTLVESHGTWSGNPGSFSYQWERCSAAGCAGIPGATNQTYALTGADVGEAIAVVEAASNSGGAGTAIASARSSVVTATSLVTLSVAPSAPVTNQTVTLAATVTSGSGNATPAGSLTFQNAAGPISGCANQSFASSAQSITVICQAAFGAGGEQLAVTYHPASGSLVGGSTSTVHTITVAQGSTSVSLAVTKQVALFKRGTYVATVVPPVGNSGPIEPTGQVHFFDRGRPIPGCQNLALKGLAATCAITYKSAGNHRITARYGGDANFAPSASAVRTVRAGKGAGGPVVLGFVSSTVRWTFYYTRAYTKLLYLQVFGISNASKLRLTCHGTGCPFVKLQASPAKSAACPAKAGSVCSTGSSVNLLPAFGKRHLAAGSQITLSITRPNWIGKYYSFTMRAGAPPLIALSCLAVRSGRPGVGC